MPLRVRGAVLGLYGGLQSAGAMMGAAAAGLAHARSAVLPWYLVAAGDFTVVVLIIMGRRAGWRGFGPWPPSMTVPVRASP